LEGPNQDKTRHAFPILNKKYLTMIRRHRQELGCDQPHLIHKERQEPCHLLATTIHQTIMRLGVEFPIVTNIAMNIYHAKCRHACIRPPHTTIIRLSTVNQGSALGGPMITWSRVSAKWQPSIPEAMLNTVGQLPSASTVAHIIGTRGIGCANV
jgi:hypothetical protein